MLHGRASQATSRTPARGSTELAEGHQRDQVTGPDGPVFA